MTEQGNYDTDFSTIQIAIDNMLNVLAKEVTSVQKDIEQRVEAVEKQIATLVLAYGEQAVFMEALIGQIAFSTVEAQKSFRDTLKEARKSMLEVMQDGTQSFVADGDKKIGQAIADVVAEKLSDLGQ